MVSDRVVALRLDEHLCRRYSLPGVFSVGGGGGGWVGGGWVGGVLPGEAGLAHTLVRRLLMLQLITLTWPSFSSTKPGGQ